MPFIFGINFLNLPTKQNCFVMTDTFEEWVTAIENVGILQKLFQYVLMFIGYRGTHLHEMKQEIHKIFLVGTGAETDPFTNDFDKKYNALTSTRNTDNIVELITSTKKLRDYFQHKDANRYSASRAHISKLLVKVIIEQCASDNECISTSSKTFNLTNNVETHSLNLTNKVETHNPNVYVHSTAYLDVTNFFNALTKRHHVNFVHKFDLESLPYGSVIIFVYFSRPSEDFSEHNKIASERISKYGM